MGGKISSNKGFKPGFCGVLFRATKSLKNVFQFFNSVHNSLFWGGLIEPGFFFIQGVNAEGKICLRGATGLNKDTSASYNTFEK